MGVKLLSTLLKSFCPRAIKNVHLSQLSGKKICIDTSIYLYRFKAQECLLEKFYLMCSLFKYYNIIPIFIFDGKPPPEKYNEIKNRRIKREQNKLEYNKLLEQFGNNITQKQEKILKRMKRNFTHITRNDILNVKDLLDGYGIKYIDAKGEADILCASLVLKKKVSAVLTEDMDLFVYGCPHVLRYLSFSNHNCLEYDLNSILKTLSINLSNFQYICILAGTDYNISKKNIFYYFNLYKKFIKEDIKNLNFINWVISNENIKKSTIEQIEKILNIYKKVIDELNNYKYFPIRYGIIDKKKLYNILKQERFVFL